MSVRTKALAIAALILAAVAGTLFFFWAREEMRFRSGFERYRKQIETGDYITVRYEIEEEMAARRAGFNPSKERHIRGLSSLRDFCISRIREKDIDEKRFFTERLFAAVERGDSGEARRAIARGADVNARNDFGKTPLMRACARGDYDLVVLLVERGAEVNEKDFDGRTALSQVAAVDNMAKIMRFLLGHGARVED